MQDTIDDTRLHRYFDGDLSADEAERVRRALDADPALRAKLEGLREVRAVVRESAAGAGSIDTDDLWARIEAGLSAEAPGAEELPAASLTTPPETVAAAPVRADAARGEAGARPQLRAIPGGGGPGGGGPGGQQGGAGRAPTSSALRPAAEPRGRRIVGIVVGALALAAAILLIVLRPGEPGPADAPIAEGPGATEGRDPGGLDLDTVGEEVASTEVLEVDFGDNSGAIFSVEGDDGGRYAVVWLADVQPKPAATE